MGKDDGGWLGQGGNPQGPEYLTLPQDGGTPPQAWVPTPLLQAIGALVWVGREQRWGHSPGLTSMVSLRVASVCMMSVCGQWSAGWACTHMEVSSALPIGETVGGNRGVQGHSFKVAFLQLSFKLVF